MSLSSQPRYSALVMCTIHMYTVYLVPVRHVHKVTTLLPHGASLWVYSPSRVQRKPACFSYLLHSGRSISLLSRVVRFVRRVSWRTGGLGGTETTRLETVYSTLPTRIKGRTRGLNVNKIARIALDKGAAAASRSSRSPSPGAPGSALRHVSSGSFSSKWDSHLTPHHWKSFEVLQFTREEKIVVYTGI